MGAFRFLVLAVFLPCLMVVAGSAGAKARAADTPVTVLGIEALEGAPESVASGLTEALRQRVSSEKGYRLVPGKDLVEVKLLFSCPDEAPSCMVEAAKSLNAVKMIYGSLKKAPGDVYLVTLMTLDANRRHVEAFVAEQIPRGASTGAAIRGPVQKWFARLTGQAALGAVRVTGDVPGTAVSLDGQPAGVIGSDALVLGNVAAGRHEVVANKPGYAPVRRDVNVTAGAATEVLVQMAAQATAPPATAPPPLSPSEMKVAPSQDQPPLLVRRSEPGSGGSNLTKWAAWGTGAAALISFGLALNFGLEVKSIDSDLDEYRLSKCPDSAMAPSGALCDRSGRVGWSDKRKNEKDFLLEEGSRFEKLQYVFIGVGAAFAVASGVLFYKGYLSDEGPVAVGRGGRPRLVVVPMASSDGGGMLARVSF